MKRRAARALRGAADHLDPPICLWRGGTSNLDAFYGPGVVTGTGPVMTHIISGGPRQRRRVLADFLSALDLKKLRA